MTPTHTLHSPILLPTLSHAPTRTFQPSHTYTHTHTQHAHAIPHLAVVCTVAWERWTARHGPQDYWWRQPGRRRPYGWNEVAPHCCKRMAARVEAWRGRALRGAGPACLRVKRASFAPRFPVSKLAFAAPPLSLLAFPLRCARPFSFLLCVLLESESVPDLLPLFTLSLSSRFCPPRVDRRSSTTCTFGSSSTAPTCSCHLLCRMCSL